MKLYSGPLSMFGAKAEIALREKGVDFDLEMVPYDREHGYQPKHPEVLRVNPKRQVPVLLDGEVEIFDSTQIFEYLEDNWPNPPLWPLSPAERWARNLELCSDEIFFPARDPSAWIAGHPGSLSIRRRGFRLGSACELLLEDGVVAGRPVLRRHGDIRRHRFLHGAVLCGPAHRADDDAASESLGVAQAHGGRPAAKQVIGAMAAYLRSIGQPVPDYA